nr:UvrD-like helicase, ATP-binding domain, P-loop containing nucleoside triphosphate hydrolase [Tanacetum cinerariifolium]
LDYHELLLLKEESGHFLEDAELARSSGAFLKEADLLEKAGKFKEAALLLLWHVFISLLWVDRNISWKLKQFSQKEELYNKGLQRDEKRTHFDGRVMVSAVRTYWQSELLSVGIKALERVIIVCLCSGVSVAVYKNLINKLKSKPRWKSFVEKFRDRGLKDVSVARALQHALDHSFGTNSSFLSVHSFGYLLDRLLLVQSFSSRKSYTTRSCFVGLFTHIRSASTLSVGQFFDLSVIIERIEDILSNSEFVDFGICQKVIEEISQVIDEKKGLAPNKLPAATRIMAHVVADNHLVVWKNLRMIVDALQKARHFIDKFFRNIDAFLNHHVPSQQVTKVEETGDEASVMSENQSECENTQDGNNEKGKGNNKKGKGNRNGKKSNKSKGKKKRH